MACRGALRRSPQLRHGRDRVSPQAQAQRRPTPPPAKGVSTQVLDRILAPQVRGGGGEQTAATIVSSDEEAAHYLHSRLWRRLDSAPSAASHKTMPGLGYSDYTDVRRGTLDILQKLRYSGVAREKTYLTVLGLCNRLNRRGRMAQRVFAMAVADGVAPTVEMHAELIRSAGGKEGGGAHLAASLKAVVQAGASVHTPAVASAVLGMLRAWGTGLQVFEAATVLCSQAAASAIPYAVLLAACATPEQATAVAEEMKRRGVALSAAHVVSMLGVCVKCGDTDAAERIVAACAERTSRHYERLMSAYKEAGCVEGVEDALRRARREGVPVTEAMVVSLLSAYALVGDGAGAVAVFDTFPAYQELFSVQRELMVCAAVRGDAEGAAAVWDVRPEWRGADAGRKVSAALLEGCRDAHAVALAKSRGGGAWAHMQCVVGCLPGHGEGTGAAASSRTPPPPRASYPALRLATSHVLQGRGFGLRATAEVVRRARAAYPEGRSSRSAVGDVHSVELDKRLLAAAVVGGKAGYVDALLRGGLRDKVVPHAASALLALGRPGEAAALCTRIRCRRLHPLREAEAEAEAAESGADEGELCTVFEEGCGGASAVRPLPPAEAGGTEETLEGVIDAMFVAVDQLARSEGPARALAEGAADDEEEEQALPPEHRMEPFLLQAWAAVTQTPWAQQQQNECNATAA